MSRYNKYQEKFQRHRKQGQEQPTENQEAPANKKKLNLKAPSLVIEEEQSFQTSAAQMSSLKSPEILRAPEIAALCPYKF